jgi:hypothetical protein
MLELKMDRTGSGPCSVAVDFAINGVVSLCLLYETLMTVFWYVFPCSLVETDG